MIKNIGKISLFKKSTQKNVHLPNFYISKFQSQQLKFKEQQKQLKELRYRKQLLQQASIIKVSDKLKNLLYGALNKPYQNEAIKNLRDQVNDLKNQLQDVFLESDKKWQEPRKIIKDLRQRTNEQFLTHFIQLQEIIGKIKSLKTESTELSQGCQLTYRMMLSILQKNGAQYYQPMVNQKFDSQKYQTADQYDQNSQIQETLAKGWKIENKIIKKSKVRVKKM